MTAKANTPGRKHRKIVRRRKRTVRHLRRKRLFGRILRSIRKWVFRVILLILLIVISLRWFNPPITYLMASEWLRLGKLEREWIPIEAMSTYLPLSAAAAEDARFCEHNGLDFDAIRAAMADNGRLRGASTISQQVAKNVFLWPDRSWVRKGFEAGFTVLIEVAWSKQRIMEVYLNVAEFGEGIFGVQAAAKYYFGRDAATLSSTQAARLMAVLPNPRGRSPARKTAFMQKRTASIVSGAGTLKAEGRATCFLVSG